MTPTPTLAWAIKAPSDDDIRAAYKTKTIRNICKTMHVGIHRVRRCVRVQITEVQE